MERCITRQVKFQSESSLSLTDFVKKEFPQFESDNRITITKNNAKLKRSFSRHEDLLHQVIDLLQEKRWRRVPISSNADILASNGKTIAVIEAKSITPENVAHQIRVGISQLYEYSFDLHSKGYHKQKLILLLEKRPEAKWINFCEYCGIELWFKENKRIVTKRYKST